MSTVAYRHFEVTSDGHARIRGIGLEVRMLTEEFYCNRFAKLADLR